jgi:ferredoxin-NADP reductase
MWRIGTVVALRDETETARTIILEVPDWPGHLAGQHVDVRLTAADGYSAVRSYSIASAPNSEKRVEITVERLPNGEVSPYLTQNSVRDLSFTATSFRGDLKTTVRWLLPTHIREPHQRTGSDRPVA